MSNKLVVFVSGLAILATPMIAFPVQAKVKHRHHHHHRHLVHFVKKPHLRGVRYSPDGDVIDRDGWRKRPSGWDNSCLNLDYLSSMYACGASGRR